MSDIEKFAGEYSFGIAAIGNPETRNEMTKRLVENCYHIPVLVHPRAFVGKYANLKRGCIVEPMAVVNSGFDIGECTFVSAGAIVNRSVLMNDCCRINIGAIVKAHSVLPMFTKVDEGKVYHRGGFVGDLKNIEDRINDFRKEYVKMYGQESSHFGGD